MKNHRQTVVVTILLAGGQIARGDLVVDHQPYRAGGLAADTDFVTDGGQPNYWQLVADDFTLGAPALISHISWWGFYGGMSSGTDQPPTGDEIMRIRFYGSRASDGLPGALLHEDGVVNPLRTWTGRYVSDSYSHKEYRFEADLATPITLGTDVTYWLEIVQSAIPDSHYRWEYSQPGDGTSYSFANPSVPDWQRSGASSNLAFQLSSVPEPRALGLFIISLTFGLTNFGGTRRKSDYSGQPPIIGKTSRKD